MGQTHQIKTHVHTIKNRNFPKNHPKMTDTVEEKVVNRKRKMSKGSAMEIDTEKPSSQKKEKVDDSELRKVFVPSHRYGPLKENWMKIFTPVVEHLKLQIRFNLKSRHVEIKMGKEAQDIASLQKAGFCQSSHFRLRSR